MSIAEILSVLKGMDIETTDLNASSMLGENIGMDSQEIVELHCNLEEYFSVELPPNILSKSFSLGELTQFVQQFIGVPQ
ncbi:acyl carrier protein [Nostoc sp. PA-18-2419]|uniref:acyl carrier protein n=1 Tax=Nostoc sp. PA-18-2419 TaxID=2575443 RepID=UPI0011096F82|nr:acyl carrier protein [Nostoc sp. PA-18-2419]